jgi:putative transposase
MMATVRMRIEPNSKQRRAIDAAIEVNRHAYNFFLTACKLIHGSKGRLPFRFELYNLATRFRHAFPGALEVHSLPLQDTASRALRAIGQGLANAEHERERAKTGKGAANEELEHAMHRPRHRNMGTYHSFTYPMYGRDYRFVQGRDSKGRTVRKLKLGKVPGEIRCYNQNTPIDGEMRNCTIKRIDLGTHYEYYASIVFERPDRGDFSLEREERWIGVDLGVANIAALSDGTVYPAERFYGEASKDLRDKSSKVGRSKPETEERGRARAKHIRANRRISDLRRDRIEKISREIVDKADVIVMEDLSIRGLRRIRKDKRMAHAYDDASLGRLRRRICDKAQGAGRRVFLVDPRGTSQICSGCGEPVPKDLSVRIHECPFCGFSADRDVNAAVNIRDRGWTGHPSPVIWENSPAPKRRRGTGAASGVDSAKCRTQV